MLVVEQRYWQRWYDDGDDDDAIAADEEDATISWIDDWEFSH